MGFANFKVSSENLSINLPGEALIKLDLRAISLQTPSWKSDELRYRIPPQVACLPMDTEPLRLYRNTQTVTGYAEMYGGAGVGPNAGGVRCANIGACQIKGIGQTILAGRSTDKWHKHGACSLQDAVKETIFSELFHIALPHGAARPIAIYDLGVTFATEIGADKLPGKAPRGLFVREPIVRLAHFMRSSFMDVGDDIAARELPRMRTLLPKLVDHLCAGKGLPCLESVEIGLLEMYWLVIEQTVAMRLKRLVHGSMIPSNFGIDGRLVDFTTATAISTLQPVVVSLGSACSQTQHKQVLDTVLDMVFYLSKFDARCRADRVQVEKTTRNIVDVLTKQYEKLVMNAHLQLIGLSDQEQQSLSVSIHDRLVKAIVRIILQGSTEGHLYYGGDEHPMLLVKGKNDLCGALLGTIARSSSPNDFVHAEVTETCAAFTNSSLAELSDAYNQACAHLQGCGFVRAHLRASHMVRAMKINADLSGLYRRHIDGEINSVCTRGGDISNFVETTLNRWKNLLRFSPTGDVLTAAWLTEDNYQLSANELTLNNKTSSFIRLFGDAYETPLMQRYVWLKPALNRVIAASS
jgi:hypothetical protein